ncbi:MAG: T9SS type A sorting domain-containing protein, partial [Taibaiella sp.]|nr:T9SS type A sorting domain-containing protein [Taibaiella sp.]
DVPKSLTSSITGGDWASDNTSVVIIDSATGIAMGVTAGTANITYTTLQGCSSSVILTAATCPTGVQTVPQNDKMKVYPNPANNIVSISVSSVEGQIAIWNMTGIKVAERKISDVKTSFDLNALTSGVYLIVWEHELSREVQRLVIK